MIKLEDILELSDAERILMIEKIWDSIDHRNLEISDAQTDELDRRLDRYNRGETTFTTWDEIKKELNSYKKYII